MVEGLASDEEDSYEFRFSDDDAGSSDRDAVSDALPDKQQLGQSPQVCYLAC